MDRKGSRALFRVVRRLLSGLAIQCYRRLEWRRSQNYRRHPRGHSWD
jgi:hypothetical protein